MSIIIVNDEYLRNLKIKYFNMDILTDVITFNLSENQKDLEAEIYISWERVCDNANIYNDTVGFNDSTEKEIEQMRCKEEEYLNNFPKDIIL